VKALSREELDRRRERSERLTHQVRVDLDTDFKEMLNKAGIKEASLFVIENPNSAFEVACATKRADSQALHIILSSVILDILTRDEVLAVVAHEIAHMAANDSQSKDSRRTKEFRADKTGAELSGRPASMASALPKIDKYLQDYKNRFLDESLPSVLSKRGSWPRAMTERVLRTAATATGAVTKFNYPTTAERISRLVDMDDRLSPKEPANESYAQYLDRIADTVSTANDERVPNDPETHNLDQSRSSRLAEDRLQPSTSYLGR